MDHAHKGSIKENVEKPAASNYVRDYDADHAYIARYWHILNCMASWLFPEGLQAAGIAIAAFQLRGAAL
jgi:hypothetical protein